MYGVCVSVFSIVFGVVVVFVLLFSFGVVFVLVCFECRFVVVMCV